MDKATDIEKSSSFYRNAEQANWIIPGFNSDFWTYKIIYEP